MFGDNHGYHQHALNNKRNRINKFDDEKREENIIFLHLCFMLMINNLFEEIQGFKSLPLHFFHNVRFKSFLAPRIPQVVKHDYNTSVLHLFQPFLNNTPRAIPRAIQRAIPRAIQRAIQRAIPRAIQRAIPKVPLLRKGTSIMWLVVPESCGTTKATR